MAPNICNSADTLPSSKSKFDVSPFIGIHRRIRISKDFWSQIKGPLMVHHKAKSLKQKNETLEDNRQLIVSCYKNRDYQNAELRAQHYLENMGQDAMVWQILGICQRHLGKTEQAIRSLSKADALKPNDVAILKSLSSALLQRNQVEEFAKVAEKLSNFNALDESIWNSWYALLHRLGKPQETLGWCESFVAMDPQSSVLNFYLSVALKNVGRLPEAISAGRRSLTLRLQKPTWQKTLSTKTGFNSEANKRVLCNVLARLKAHDIHAFPTAGTLLGLVREGGLLNGDKDIDLALWYAEMDDAIKVLITMGWHEVGGSYTLSNPRQIKHPEHQLTIDLCGLKKEKHTGKTIGGFWMSNIPAEWNRITEFPEFELTTRQTESGEIWWPAEPEVWLETLYGDWRKPDKEFDTTICAKNLRSFSYLVECYGVQRTFAHWNEGDIPRALKIINSMLHHRPDDQLFLELRRNLSTFLEG